MRIGTSERWHVTYTWLSRLQGIATFLVAVVGAFLKVSKGQSISLWSVFLDFIHNNGVSIILGCSVVLAIAQALKASCGSPWVGDLVKFLLEELHKDVFSDRNNVSAFKDRVTLFRKVSYRYRFCCFPSGDWLCAVERAGHMTRRRRKWFRVGDDGQNVEGVAGQTWVEGRTIRIENLPVLGPNATPQEVEFYAKSAFISSDHVRRQLKRKSPLPQVFVRDYGRSERQALGCYRYR